MANRLLKRFFYNNHYTKYFAARQEVYRRLADHVMRRWKSRTSGGNFLESNSRSGATEFPQVASVPVVESTAKFDSKRNGGEENDSSNKWNLEPVWLTKTIEPALQFCRWALPGGNGTGNKIPPSGRSISEIITSIQRSKIGIEDWTLSDFTIGLYLLYLRQGSVNALEDVKGIQVSSEATIEDLIYHLELAKGCYKGDVAGLVRHSMLRERNILKYVKDSSVMRPGYYIAIDPRKKLVILGIRGTHTVYDLITDIVSSSDDEVTFEGYSTHFGTAEAARWFHKHEMQTIKKCLEEHEGYRFRVVGHSLGGAIASLLAIMLRRCSHEELGFSPDLVSAVGYATPPCVSSELAESCSEFVMNVVMQDDVVPRLSAASLARMRNEILHTDWTSVIEKEDWKSVIGLVTNAKQVVSSVQDVAGKLADFAKLWGKGSPARAELVPLKDSPNRKAPLVPLTLKPSIANAGSNAKEGQSTSRSSRENIDSKENEPRNTNTVPAELFVPGCVYYLKRNVDTSSGSRSGERGLEYFTLLKRRPGEHFQKIVLSNNIISDHKCDSHQFALRDVLKGLSAARDEVLFRQ
ncbi:Diacylglycerol lipase-beta [Linum perenne]